MKRKNKKENIGIPAQTDDFKASTPSYSESLSRRGFMSVAGMALAGSALPVIGPYKNQVTQANKPALLDSVDVLVVGGGPAGIGAAIGSALTGAKTLIIENHSFFGGVASWALGMPVNQIMPEGKSRSRIHDLVVNKIKAYGDQAVNIGTHQLWCNVEYLKVAVLDALDEVGCKYLVHVRAADAIVENNRVTGVVIATKRGLKTIRAKVVVDCTGDGDIAYYAGAETMIDPDILMPMTLSLGLTNINNSKVTPDDLKTVLRNAKKKYPLITSAFLEIKPVAHSNSWYINHGGTSDLGRIDATDPVERTMAECWSRRQALQMMQALHESDNPEINCIEWINSGPQVSVRETRRIKGSYIITNDDAMSGRIFEDAIAWRSGFLDPGGQKGAQFVKMQIHDVPYRAIVPEKLDGLLMAGRCISTTHEATAAGKSMGNCMATGHAAGLAAAMSAKKNCMPRELKVKELQDALRSDGVKFNLEKRDQVELMPN